MCKKPESAKSGTKEDVEAYIEERVDEPSLEEFPMSSILQGPAPAKIVKWQIIKTGKRGLKKNLKGVCKAMLEKKLLGDKKDEVCYQLLKLIEKQAQQHKDWLVQEQTALGKDFSNPFMADNLPKIVWLSTHHIYVCKELASPQGYGLSYKSYYSLSTLDAQKTWGSLKLLVNFIEKYLDLEVAFRKSICFVRDLQRNDLLTGTCGYDIYTISLQESSLPTTICFMAKASPTQAWLWHRLLSHLNFDTINLLLKNDIMNGLPKLKYTKDQRCSSCEIGKAKRSNFKTKNCS
ncbi:retrovirus-related pol polyprotein from transposon TNT 1-94 [Tanacetum coccineum]